VDVKSITLITGAWSFILFVWMSLYMLCFS
jgi:hypothetical protein